MNEQITLTIDHQDVTVSPDTTILKAAQQLGIEIPTICYHDYCTANALCRLCVVEVEGARTLIPSCIAKVSSGMVVNTNTERVLRSRRTILEMLASTVDLSEAPEILDMLQTHDARPDRFPEAAPRSYPVLDDNPMYIRDYAKCILCWRCVQVCAEDAQYAFAINFKGRGYDTQISTFYDITIPETTCVFCGQCLGVCPTGALKPKRQWLFETGYNPSEIMELTRKDRMKTAKRNRVQKAGAQGEKE